MHGLKQLVESHLLYPHPALEGLQKANGSKWLKSLRDMPLKFPSRNSQMSPFWVTKSVARNEKGAWGVSCLWQSATMTTSPVPSVWRHPSGRRLEFLSSDCIDQEQHHPVLSLSVTLWYQITYTWKTPGPTHPACANSFRSGRERLGIQWSLVLVMITTQQKSILTIQQKMWLKTRACLFEEFGKGGSLRWVGICERS